MAYCCILCEKDIKAVDVETAVESRPAGLTDSVGTLCVRRRTIVYAIPTQVMALLLSATPANYCPIKMRIFILLPRVRIFYFITKIRYPSMTDVKFYAPFL